MDKYDKQSFTKTFFTGSNFTVTYQIEAENPYKV